MSDPISCDLPWPPVLMQLRRDHHPPLPDASIQDQGKSGWHAERTGAGLGKAFRGSLNPFVFFLRYRPTFYGCRVAWSQGHPSVADGIAFAMGVLACVLSSRVLSGAIVVSNVRLGSVNLIWQGSRSAPTINAVQPVAVEPPRGNETLLRILSRLTLHRRCVRTP